MAPHDPDMSNISSNPAGDSLDVAPDALPKIEPDEAESERKPSTDRSPILPLPIRRCLTKEQAADYLGIGVTLLLQIGPAPIKFGRRSVWDIVDLNAWLDQYKGRGRAGKEVVKWPVQEESTAGETPVTGGSMWYYRTADAYAKALRRRDGKKPKR